MEKCKTIGTPAAIAGGAASAVENLLLVSAVDYQRLVGKLLYAVLGTRFDIVQAVQVVAADMKAPTQADWTNALRVLCYFKGTVKAGIIYRKKYLRICGLL